MSRDIIERQNSQLAPFITNVAGDQNNYSGNITINQIQGLDRKAPAFLTTRDTSFYSLFILPRNSFNTNTFTLKINCCLNTCCCDESSAFNCLTPNDINTITTYPCLFIEINNEMNKPGINQVAYAGILQEIVRQGDDILFSFSVCKDIPQVLILNNTQNLAINKAPLRSELDKVHWAIKKWNLNQSLTDLGL